MSGIKAHLGMAAALLMSPFVAVADVYAFRIELKDVAPDRIERQRAEAIGQIPLPGTPNISQFEERLKSLGVALGAPMFIRVFKAESELEVWLQKGSRFELFATYPICHWSGTLGPKITEGDKQTPEGIYTVTTRQLHASARHPQALNLGFPNVLDRHLERTGSYILIHGGCGSVGCFGMTNPVIDEIFTLARAALREGQEAINVHSFPFRLTDENLRAHANSEWSDFWANLKVIFDVFNQTRRIPKIKVCEDRYWVEQDEPGKTAVIVADLPATLGGQPHSRCSFDKRLDANAVNSWMAEIPVTLTRDEHATTQAKKAVGDHRRRD